MLSHTEAPCSLFLEYPSPFRTVCCCLRNTKVLLQRFAPVSQMLHSLSSDLVLFLKHSTPFERLAVVSETPKFLSSGLLLKFLQTSKPFEWFAPLLWHTEALFERIAPVSRTRWSLSSRLLKHSSPFRAVSSFLKNSLVPFGKQQDKPATLNSS